MEHPDNRVKDRGVQENDTKLEVCINSFVSRFTKYSFMADHFLFVSTGLGSCLMNDLIESLVKEWFLSFV